MSNAMSRSKSRWKGALLATVAGAVVSPMAANASMTLGVYLNPLGSAGPLSLKYITPDQNGTTIPLYVYATVTGSGAVTSTVGSSPTQTISGGDFSGLQYVYYNLLATGGNSSGITGGITATTLNSTLGFDSSTGDPSSNTSAGTASQTGLVDLAPASSLAAATTVVAVGAPSAYGTATPVAGSVMTQFAKPRAGGPVWSNYASYNGSNYTYLNDGTNIVIGTGSNGLATNQVAFLVEKISYTPSAFTASTAGSPASLVSTTFSIQAPFNGSTSLLASTSYAPSNSFNDSSTSVYTYSSTSGSSLAAVTSSNYSAGHSVTITDTIGGDANGDGRVDFNDLLTLAQDYGKPDTLWSQGNFTNGAYPTVDFNSLLTLAQNYGKNIGALPSGEVAELAQAGGPTFIAALAQAQAIVASSSVPEPTSMGLLTVGAAGLLARRRKASSDGSSNS